MLNEAGKNLRTKFSFPLTVSLLFFCIQAGFAETIIDRELTVLRGDFKEVHYLIPKGTKDSVIQGRFECKGGLNDDVNFYAFTMDQYVRWYSNYKNRPILKMEKKRQATFEFPVKGEETYYFVFDNFFSTVSNKEVKLEVRLLNAKDKKDEK